MLPGMELMGCQNLAVPPDVMHHVVRVESSYNPYAIGVVGGRLVRQPKNLPEAVGTARMLEQGGYNFSLGLAQVNRYNLRKYGLTSYEQAFDTCPNLSAGSRILAECHDRAGGDWGKAFSCYYSGNFITGYRHGYVQKVVASMRAAAPQNAMPGAQPIAVVPHRTATPANAAGARHRIESASLVARRGEVAAIAASPSVSPAAAQQPQPYSPALPRQGHEDRVVVSASTQPLQTPSMPPMPLPASPRSNHDQAFIF